ncbi:MAG: hypothetical protein BGO29_01365 [Bacteroidales bacterium 36-12]|nr:MAG: hypothetical protein BGO29_01365 [Bacteroidales bacterium 36-12]
MKRIFISLFVALISSVVVHAGTWVVGVNHVVNLLESIEQGTGDVPPEVPYKVDPLNEENRLVNTDLEVWELIDGITLTEEDVQPEYLDWENPDNHWRAFVAIDFSDKGYKQKDETVISFIQPSVYEFDYPGGVEPLTGDDYANYCDRRDLRWLEYIDLSGNDFHTIEIDGGIYQDMILKEVNLSNNPNLTSLIVENCAALEVLDISNTGLSAADIQDITDAVLDASPDAQIIVGATSVGKVDSATPFVYATKNNIMISNKNPDATVEVYDIFGRMIVRTANNDIEISNFNRGVYLVKVGDQVTKIKK